MKKNLKYIIPIVLVLIVVILFFALRNGSVSESGTASTEESEVANETGSETESVIGTTTEEGVQSETVPVEAGGEGTNEGSSENGSLVFGRASSGRASSSAGKDTEKTPISFPYTADADGLQIQGIYNYSGFYIEDGDDTSVDSVAVMNVTNVSDRTIEYGEIHLQCGSQMLDFKVSLIPSGASAIVMEASKKSFSDGESFTYEGSQIAYLESLDMAADRVKISKDSNGALIVENVSGADINEVRIFYKNRLDTGEYVGGIAYNVHLETLKAGESRVVSPSHFDPEYGTVMMVRIY